VALFVTCLVDLFRPTVGFAAIKLLEQAGCRVEVPSAQVCCGQPAYNSGDRPGARAIARQVIAAFACPCEVKQHKKRERAEARSQKSPNVVLN